jgi:hypothetical protein
MTTDAPTAAELAEALPGRWTLRATNFPMWLKAENQDPVFEYELLSSEPLRFRDTVHYRDAGKDAPRTINGTDRARGSGFVWRGRGLLGLLSSRWSVTGIDGDILALRFERSAVTPAGVDLLVREGVEIAELRREVAADLDKLGITIEEFASLSWLDHIPA